MEQSIELSDHMDDFIQYRKDLIPQWMKFFGWIFILMAVIGPLYLITSAIFGYVASYKIFGITYIGSALSVEPLLIIGLYVINGICAYGLLFGKDWGLAACLACGYFCFILVMWVIHQSGWQLTQLEPLIQIPFLYQLHKLTEHWHGNQE